MLFVKLAALGCVGWADSMAHAQYPAVVLLQLTQGPKTNADASRCSRRWRQLLQLTLQCSAERYAYGVYCHR
jgi:hypothetical protein